MANTHSHLTLSERIYIEQALERRMKFKDIALFIEKDPTTVSKEIRRHRVAKEAGRKTAVVRKPKHLYKAAYVPPALLQQDVREMYTALLPFLLRRIILLRYAEGLLLHLMFAMAVGFGAAGRIQSIITVHR